MPRLIIDRREIEVAPGTTVIEAAARLGIVIPRFCYHPALGPVGACRVCAVRFLQGPVKGVEMSCMVDAHDGMVVSTTDPEAVEFRRYVIEWLMLNHPHDCPVCDEGGECLLQDETVSGGHGLRRYRGRKRTYRDQHLGHFVQHEMNRCIHCWRCRRFYQEFAGYRDLGAMQIANRTYFGRYRDGALESPFAGNLVDLCPTGVYTDKPSRFKGRRWDLERAPSLCLHCSLGCNTVGSARYREMLRQEARFSGAVNGYFICDRGRYGFAYANHPERPRRARVAGREVPWEEGLKEAAARLAALVEKHGPGTVACLGSARSSLETQGQLQRFCRLLNWPAPAFFADPDAARLVKKAAARLDAGLAVSLRDIESADFVAVVGADPVNEAPMLALALRQARRRGATVAVLDPRPVTLPLEFVHLALAPAHLDLGLAVLVKGGLERAAAEGKLAPGAAQFFEQLPSLYQPDPWLQDRLAALWPSLEHSRKPVMVCGTGIVRETTADLAADLTRLLQAGEKQAGLFYLLPGANAFGAALVRPNPLNGDKNLGEIIEDIESGSVKALILVESDPFWDYPDGERLARALEKLELLVALDYLPSVAVSRAQVVLPTLTHFERAGSSFINQEARVQAAAPVHYGGAPLALVSDGKHPPRTFLGCVPGGDPRPAWQVLSELYQALTGREGWQMDDLWDWLAEQNPVFSRAASRAQEPQGVRLLPEAPAAPEFPAALAPEAPPPEDVLELLLVDETYGTEELSSYSSFTRQVEELPRLLISSHDLCRLGLCTGGKVDLQLPGGTITVELKAEENQAPGVLVLPRHRALAWQKITERPVLLPAAALKGL
jgi:NADH-quinone oxidoreductase subunit G